MGDGIEIVGRHYGRETHSRDSRRTARNAGSDLGHSKYFLRLEIVRIGVPRLLAVQHPHAASHLDAFGGGLHQRFVDQDRRRRGVLEIEVGVLSALGKRRSEVMLEVSLGQAVAVEEEAIDLGHKKFLLPVSLEQVDLFDLGTGGRAWPINQRQSATLQSRRTPPLDFQANTRSHGCQFCRAVAVVPCLAAPCCPAKCYSEFLRPATRPDGKASNTM